MDSTPMLLDMPSKQTDDAQYLSIISLWQPWASWVIWGWKTIETRTHDKFRNLAGKRIGIHAAKKWDDNAIHTAHHYFSDGQYRAVNSRARHYPRGFLLGTVHDGEHRALTTADAAAAMIECDTKRFGLLLTDIRKFATPIAMRGCQGIWTVPVDQIRDAIKGNSVPREAQSCSSAVTTKAGEG